MHCVSATIHRDTWDRILCEGVPVSLRELVSLVAAQLQMVDDEQNRKRLLQCSWRLGWHVKARDANGVTKKFWGGGADTENNQLFETR